jgi:hypothetical protein
MSHVLDPVAGTFAATVLAALQREYPNEIRHRMDHADDHPRPHEIHPAFFGCYDWHSAVHMHWALVRLARHCPDLVPPNTRDVLDDHLSAESLAVEAAYFETHPSFSRPYGWGWVFTLATETAEWNDPQAQRWATHLAPLTTILSVNLQRWLVNADHPLRNGAHTNSAFSLARTWRWSADDPPLRAAIVDAATRWFADDRDYPARWEPDGADFLSPTLTEIELMSMVLDPIDFERWYAGFLPEIPDSLLTPVRVTDTSDGQIAHLHGLNLSRAHGLRTLSTALGGNDLLERAATAHLAASIDRVSGDDYMVEHWLASYAILALTGP